MLKNRGLALATLVLVCLMVGSVGTLAALGKLPTDTLFTLPVAQAQGQFVPVLEGFDSPFTQVVDTVLPCVVGVSNHAQARFFSGREETVEQASGSGVVISTQGHIVTNYHVVSGAKQLYILWQGKQYPADLVGVDALTDLAVIQAREVSLPAVTMGNSDLAKVGDWAVVIGNPLGQQFADTVTVGILSGLGREIEDSPVRMMQTDAAINSGNSGGGLFNTRGELIGIPSMKFSGASLGVSIEGIGMAIPINTARPIVESIMANGKVIRPRMGVGIATLRGTEAAGENQLPSGVYIVSVERGSPAAKAGIQTGDIVTHIDGARVHKHTELSDIVNTHQAGDVLTLTLYRVPGIENLTVQDRIPVGETLSVQVTLQNP